MGFKPGNYKGRQVKPEVTLRSRYLWFFKFAYKRRAKRKNLEVTITDDDFIRLVTTDCHYCGKSWQSETRICNRSPVAMLTIDRKDSKLGYILENCVSSCKECNTIKMETPYTEFIARLKRIIAHLEQSGSL